MFGKRKCNKGGKVTKRLNKRTLKKREIEKKIMRYRNISRREKSDPFLEDKYFRVKDNHTKRALLPCVETTGVYPEDPMQYEAYRGGYIKYNTEAEDSTGLDSKIFDTYIDPRFHTLSFDRNRMWEVYDKIINSKERIVFPKHHRRAGFGVHNLVVEYKLPITSYSVCKIDKVNNKRKYYRFNGQKIPVNTLCIRKGDVFIPLRNEGKNRIPEFRNTNYNKSFSVESSDYVPDLVKIPFTLKTTYSDTGNYFPAITKFGKLNYCSNPYTYNNNLFWTGKIDGINITFTKEQRVTHIGTLGKRYIIDNFPSYTEWEEWPDNKKDEIRNVNIPYICENEDHYVLQYQILYVDEKGNWNDLGQFKGNCDRVTEVIHRFEKPIFTSKMKIIPYSFVRSPSIQISLYDDKPKNEEATHLSYLVSFKPLVNYEPKQFSRYRRNSLNRVQKCVQNSENLRMIKYEVSDYNNSKDYSDYPSIDTDDCYRIPNSISYPKTTCERPIEFIPSLIEDWTILP